MAYLVSEHENPSNYPIYAVEDELRSSIFHINDKKIEASMRKATHVKEKNIEYSVWNMYFDGSCSKEGSGDGIVFISPSKQNQ